ncbi:type II toxin-antitoxin system Phd/YefM family antitoxin [Thiocystis violacea]|uniref:type II toxin-antitoxin system Phd/YefM family antitoxin n=1 Tax=Thiocystis violacea TaxID=13725 RepID=UPI00190643DF|nr:type II toxin-antitoxin system Phd/YefM family antitoxin [Thiocystis violacea]MBK1724150.1 type II toxin-antitoxin system prevent-host-death family antitoxin [Thiocystis violacea]
MSIITADEASAKLYSLIDETATTHHPITIQGTRVNAVMISEEDWNAISETLSLMSIPGMRDSIVEGLKNPTSQCSKDLDW